MKILHIVAGLEESNGMANTARQFAEEECAQGHKSVVTNDLTALDATVDVVCLHGAWLPILWRAATMARHLGVKLVIRPAGSYDPVRLAYHAWKKRLVAFFEHRMLMRADVVLATCSAEAEWIRAYEPRVKKIELTDLKRFFGLSRVECADENDSCGEYVERAGNEIGKKCSLHLLYLGRRHPLKGLEYLEGAVKQIQHRKDSTSLRLCAKIVSNAFGEEKEKVWGWCDVLVLPTLSENFGRVVAEALERGKRVITTDGAPAWGSECKIGSVKCKVGGGEIWSGYEGRLLYLKGYRDGSPEVRIALLEDAIINLLERRVECVSG